jgi:hypothetical protein
MLLGNFAKDRIACTQDGWEYEIRVAQIYFIRSSSNKVEDNPITVGFGALAAKPFDDLVINFPNKGSILIQSKHIGRREKKNK